VLAEKQLPHLLDQLSPPKQAKKAKTKRTMSTNTRRRWLCLVSGGRQVAATPKGVAMRTGESMFQ